MIVPRLALPISLALQRVSRRVAEHPHNLRILQRHMSSVYFRSGAIKPKPEEMPFGLLAIFCAVIPGLFVGATISKNVANFLEENDLFVPADDDDDED
ncbi:essential MCU regulator, mitochondrial [Drosophila sechellia]|uniref:Essential MCU regulator, mitochondrial n=5 Tax=melanogaster subgroup TaxID=32351 RepID=EMRE_DROME|eukprot:NP_611294.1 essential MCU regulator [Drosophila melanogaster]